MSRKNEVIRDNSQKLRPEVEAELNKSWDMDIDEYLKATRLIIKGLEEQRKVNNGFLVQIEVFIEYAKNQLKNKNLSDKMRLKYLDLIEEEESLHDRIQEDLKRNNELIKSIKKSTDALFH